MTTENSLNAALVEPIGDADNAQNVTSVEPMETEAVANDNVEEQVNLEENRTDFSEEDAALDAEKAGLAIGEETAEELSAEEVDTNDLSGKSKQELVEMFASLLESEPVQTLRKSVEAIKIAFY